MKSLHRDDIINWGLLLLLGVVWGFSFFFIKRGLVAFDPFQVGAIRIFFAFLSFIPLFFYIGFKVPRKKLPMVLISALLGSGIPPFLFAIAQQRIDSGVTGILNALTPLFALLAGFIVFRIKVKLHHIIGVFVGLAGSVIVVLVKSDGSFEFNFAYSLLVVLATMFYGFNANIIKSSLHDVHPIQIALITFSFTGPMAGIYLFTTDFLEVVRTHDYAWQSLTYLALLSVFGTGYALILFNYLAHRTSALFATMVTYIIPLVAMAIGVFDGEHLGWVHIIGLTLILSGVYVSSIRKRIKEEF
ncbi:MAG: EamA family transporter [Bacteroidetes bacterium]|nr:EamA family transporter [Bacteroidota bacterium]